MTTMYTPEPWRPPTALQIIAADCARLAMDLDATSYPGEWSIKVAHAQALAQLGERVATLARRVARLAELLHERGAP